MVENTLCTVTAQVSKETELFELVELCVGDVLEMAGTCGSGNTLGIDEVDAAVVSWERAFQIGRVILWRCS